MASFRPIAFIVLLTKVFFHDGHCFDVLDIIVWSNGSSATSNSSVKGLRIDVVSGSNTTLQAVALMNVSEEVSLLLEWYKDGNIVDASYDKRSLRFNRNETTGGVEKAYFNLPISAVNGNKSGNYSVKFFNHSTVDDLYFELSEAYVVVTVDEAQRPAFTVFPKSMTNCSSTSSSPKLSYAAVGFPKPVYTLRCSGMQNDSQPSTSGEFLVLPDFCCLGAQCVATAFNHYHEPVDSPPTIFKEVPPPFICQQRASHLLSAETAATEAASTVTAAMTVPAAAKTAVAETKKAATGAALETAVAAHIQIVAASIVCLVIVLV